MIFQDRFTRWHHKPMTEGEKYPSNNPYIYSAECVASGLPVDFSKIEECIRTSRTGYGFTRHPDQSSPALSHDEVFGIVFVLAISAPILAKDLIKQFEKQHWQICDLPDFKPTPWYKLNWIGVIIDFYKIYKLGVLYKKTDGKEGVQNRHATPLFPRVHPIAFHMGGWKRYLIKRHAGVGPTLYEKVGFLFAKLFTIYSDREIDSGKRILGFQLLMLKDKTILEKLIQKLYDSRYNFKEVAAFEYSPGHPILEKL